MDPAGTQPGLGDGEPAAFLAEEVEGMRRFAAVVERLAEAADEAERRLD